MMIVSQSYQHPSPLLNVDSSPVPLDSLSGRHVQVTKHPEGPAPLSQPTKLLDRHHGSLLTELSPYTGLPQSLEDL